jgi:hypothetical protein
MSEKNIGITNKCSTDYQGLVERAGNNLGHKFPSCARFGSYGRTEIKATEENTATNSKIVVSIKRNASDTSHHCDVFTDIFSKASDGQWIQTRSTLTSLICTASSFARASQFIQDNLQ